MFAGRQGFLLKLKKHSNHKCSSIFRNYVAFQQALLVFLILLRNLVKEYPELCYCAIPIHTFTAYMKIIC